MPGTGWTPRRRPSPPRRRKTPDGAIKLLVGLSRDYGGIEAYAEGLLVLREDLRDPALRARGAAWKRVLSGALDAASPTAGAPRGIGLLMAAQWQGSLLWWSFEPKGKVEDYVDSSLEGLCRCGDPTRLNGLS